jgi:branched-chain amino acid transport system permease protein
MFIALLAGALLNGIVTGMIYALLGIGLALILGLLNIPNFAQGVMYALGGYFLFTVAHAWLGFWGGVLVAPLGVAVIGGLIEYAGVRRLYGVHPDYILLLTFGLALVFTELIILIWGAVGMTVFPPRLLAGGVNLGVTFYPKYRLAIMVFTVLLVLERPGTVPSFAPVSKIATWSMRLASTFTVCSPWPLPLVPVWLVWPEP